MSLNKQVEISEAELQFFDLIDEVEKGCEITIIRNGKSVAKLMPISAEESKLWTEERRN